jgi:hypothetical protein
MTRVCNWCTPEHVLGEKCFRCNSENVKPVQVLAGGEALFLCFNDRCPVFVRTNVRYAFQLGDGGTTNGICQAALAKASQPTVVTEAGRAR